MKSDEAQLLVAALVAAFPHPRIPRATIALYNEQFGRLADAEAARTSVELLIANEERFPPIAILLREYRMAARRNMEERSRVRGLDEPPPDPENARKAREYLERLTGRMAERSAEGGLSEREGNEDARRSTGREEEQ
jgi:hypothetical protein